MAMLNRTVTLAHKDDTSGLTTDTHPGVILSPHMLGPQAALIGSLIIRALTGTAPSITGTVQHSPSPPEVPDASAIWVTLLTFTAQTGVGSQQQTTTGPVFPRLRATVTRGGTAVTDLDYTLTVA